ADAVGGPGAEARRMIEINLLPGKKKKPSGGAGFKLALPDFQGLLASIKNPWLLAASAASLIVIWGGLLLFITQSTRLPVLESRLDEHRVETRRFDPEIAHKRESEKIRDSLGHQININRGVPLAHRCDPRDVVHRDRGGPAGDGVQRVGAVSGGGLGLHPYPTRGPVGEVASWPCYRRTDRVR